MKINNKVVNRLWADFFGQQGGKKYYFSLVYHKKKWTIFGFPSIFFLFQLTLLSHFIYTGWILYETRLKVLLREQSKLLFQTNKLRFEESRKKSG